MGVAVDCVVAAAAGSVAGADAEAALAPGVELAGALEGGGPILFRAGSGPFVSDVPGGGLESAAGAALAAADEAAACTAAMLRAGRCRRSQAQVHAARLHRVWLGAHAGRMLPDQQ